jgi:hypothetical protein
MIEKHHKPEIFVLGFEVIDASGKVTTIYDLKPGANLDLYKHNKWGNSPVMVRRDIALANPYLEDRALSGSEDYELWLRLSSRYTFHLSLHKTQAYIYHESNSTVTMRDPQQLIDRYSKFLHYTTTNEYTKAYLGPRLRYFVMSTYLLLAVDLVIARHKSLGLKYLTKAFLSSPLLLSQRGFYAFVKYFLK